MAILAFPNPSTVSGQCPTWPDNARTVTPSDADTFGYPVSIQVGGAGTIAFIPWSEGPNGATQTTSLPAGGTLGCRVCAVKATGTTATGILACY